MPSMLPPVVLEIKARAAEALTTLDAVATKVRSTGELNIQSMGKASGAVAVGAAAVATGLGMVIASSAKAAADFQQSMTKLATSAGEPVGNLKMVSDGILQIARDTGATTEQLSDGMYKIASAGFHGAEGLNVLKAAEQGAKAEGADLETVADAVSSALIDYHMKASDSADVTSKLVAATAAGKMRFQDLAGAMPAILPVASASHVALSDILGDMASMTVHGMSAQQSSENLADTIRHMINPTAQQAKELALLGLTTTQLAGDLQSKGLSGTLQEISTRIQSMMAPGTDKVILDMKTALSGLGQPVKDLAAHLFDGSMSMKEYSHAALDLDPVSAKQAQSFATLLGATHRIGDEQVSGAQVMQNYTQALAKATGDATGLKVALMLTGENADYTNQAIKSISGATADAAGNVKGWSEIQGNFNTKMDQAKQVFETVKIAVGQALLPILGDLLDKFMQFAGPIIEWIGHNKELVAGILITTAVVAGLIAVAAALNVALWALTLNPIGLAIAAIILVVVALVAAIVWLVQNWSTVTSFLTDVWNGFVGWVKDVTNGFVGWWNDIWSGFGNWIKSLWQGYINFVLGIYFGFLNAIVNFLRPIISTISAIWEGFWGGPFGKLIVNVFRLIQVTIQFVISWIVVFIKDYITTVWNIWSTVWTNVASFFTTVWNGIVSFVTTVANAVYNAISGPIQAVAGFISGALSWIGGVWDAAWNGYWSTVKTVWDFIVNGVTGAVHMVTDAVSGVGQNILDTIGGFVSQAFNAGANIVNSIANGITSAVGAVGDAIGSVVNFIAEHLPKSPAKRGALSGTGYTLYSGRKLVEDLARGMTDSAGLVDAASAFVTSNVRVTGGAPAFAGVGQSATAYAPPRAGAGGRPGVGNQYVNVTAQTNATGPQIADAVGWALRNQN